MFEKIVRGVSISKEEKKDLGTCRSDAARAAGMVKDLQFSLAGNAEILALILAARKEGIPKGEERALDKGTLAAMEAFLKGRDATAAIGRMEKSVDEREKLLRRWAATVEASFRTLDEAFERLVKKDGAPTDKDKHLDDPAGEIAKFLKGAGPDCEKAQKVFFQSVSTVIALLKPVKPGSGMGRMKKLKAKL